MRTFRNEHEFAPSELNDGPSLELDLAPTPFVAPPSPPVSHVAHPPSAVVRVAVASVPPPAPAALTSEIERPEVAALPVQGGGAVEAIFAVPHLMWKRMALYPVFLALANEAFFGGAYWGTTTWLVFAVWLAGLGGLGVHRWVNMRFDAAADAARGPGDSPQAARVRDGRQGDELPMTIAKWIAGVPGSLWLIRSVFIANYAFSRSGLELLGISLAGVVGILRLVHDSGYVTTPRDAVDPMNPDPRR